MNRLKSTGSRLLRTPEQRERRVIPQATCIDFNGEAAIDHLVVFDEHRIGAGAAFVLKPDTGEPVPALGCMHPPQIGDLEKL